MMYDLKTDIAKRIAKKSYLLKQALIGNDNIATREYIIISALKAGLSKELKDTSRLEKELQDAYVKYLVNSYDDSDLLDYLVDLERDEALVEPMHDTDDEYEYLTLPRGEIGL